MRATVLYEDGPALIRALIQEVMPVLFAHSTRCVVFPVFVYCMTIPSLTVSGVFMRPAPLVWTAGGLAVLLPFSIMGNVPIWRLGEGAIQIPLPIFSPIQTR